MSRESALTGPFLDDDGRLWCFDVEERGYQLLPGRQAAGWFAHADGISREAIEASSGPLMPIDVLPAAIARVSAAKP